MANDENILDYAQYDRESKNIKDTIDQIVTELNTTNENIGATLDESSGNWKTADENEWADIYKQISDKIVELESFISDSDTSTKELSETEDVYTGLGVDVH